MIVYSEKQFAKSVIDLENAEEEVKLTKQALEHVQNELTRANADLTIKQRMYDAAKRALNAPPPAQSVTPESAPDGGFVPGVG